MPSLISAAANALQHMLPQAWFCARAQRANISQQLGRVHQAAGMPPGRPAGPASSSSISRARDLLVGVAHQESGERRRFAMDMVLNANAAQRRGERALGATILATGLATFFPSKVEASGHTPTLPEALHGGWQANFGRGVAALISRVHDQLQQVQLDANADVIHGNRPRDTLLEEIRKDGRITAEYRHAITKAALLNKNGRPTEALAALRDAPAHQRLMEYFKAPEDTPVASRAAHALFVAHEALFDFGKLANGDEETTGNVGQHVAYARENPDVLRVRGLVQSVGAELYRVGAYNDVLAVVRPPVPPRPAT